MDYLSVDFFLGANTSHGFHSHFEQLQDPARRYHTYMIKGSAGSGKSTLMKHLANTVTPANPDSVCERIHCSSDPNSLDGVIWNDKKVCILDATPPHTLEPQHAGALEEIVSFYEAFDIPALRKRSDEIVATTASISRLHKRFCEILHCMNLLLENNNNILTPTLDRHKMNKTIDNLAHRTLKKNASATRPGQTQVRLLSAFTPEGLLTYENSVTTLCQEVYLLKDEYGIVSDAFLRTLHGIAVRKGHDCILCYSPFAADCKVDHLLIPSLSLGFVSQNYFQPLTHIEPHRVMNANRFYRSDVTRSKKQRLRFCRKITAQLMGEGISVLQQAKAEHDLLEDCYRGAVNFTAIDHIAQKLRANIERE